MRTRLARLNSIFRYVFFFRKIRSRVVGRHVEVTRLGPREVCQRPLDTKEGATMANATTQPVMPDRTWPIVPRRRRRGRLATTFRVAQPWPSTDGCNSMAGAVDGNSRPSISTCGALRLGRAKACPAAIIRTSSPEIVS